MARSLREQLLGMGLVSDIAFAEAERDAVRRLGRPCRENADKAAKRVESDLRAESEKIRRFRAEARQRAVDVSTAVDRALTKLQQTVAPGARPYDPRELYQSGETIYHPAFGAGKVTSVSGRRLRAIFQVEGAEQEVELVSEIGDRLMRTVDLPARRSFVKKAG